MSVGVYVLVYNGESTIKHSIESIVNQDTKYDRLVIIDDGSTDKTLDILKMLSTKYKMTIIEHESNKGFSSTNSEIFKIAVEDYICIYHADDLYRENILGLSVNYLEKNSSASAVFSTSDSNSIHLPEKYKIKDWSTKTYTKTEIFKDIMKFYNFILCPSGCFRRKIIQDNNIYFGNKKIRHLLRQGNSCEDLVTWFEIMRYGNIGIIPLPLMTWSSHENQMSKKVKKNNLFVSDFVTVIDYYLSTNYTIINKHDLIHFNFIKFRELTIASINNYVHKNDNVSIKQLDEARKNFSFKYFFTKIDSFLYRRYFKWLCMFFLMRILYLFKQRYIVNKIKKILLSDY